MQTYLNEIPITKWMKTLARVTLDKFRRDYCDDNIFDSKRKCCQSVINVAKNENFRFAVGFFLKPNKYHGYKNGIPPLTRIVGHNVNVNFMTKNKYNTEIFNFIDFSYCL